MHLTAAALALMGSIVFGLPTQDSETPEAPFPASTALAESVSPESLARLHELVQELVDEEEVVGAELMVIVNGRSILHEAYGWQDKQAQLPMETGSLFCVRSMTKPLIGASILMLVDDNQLEFDDKVSKYLPAFDVDGSREITIEHLLTHTSGLPMSLIIDKDLNELDGIGAVAELGASYDLDFEPGSAFEYSDQGTDTLTALIEVVSGMPVADFVRERVLEPLGMQSSACVLPEEHPLRARAIGNYAGSRGQWTRYWSPEDPPLFPFFLGSQALYSTLEDYARFAELWLRKGRGRDGRLLRSRSVRKALSIGPQPMRAPTGFPGLRVDYGCLMQLWTGEGEEGEREVVVFGHTGSDGTHAWVFPEQKAMVMYFTQSRNNSTGLRVEERLGELFLGAPFDPNQAAPPFEEYMGYYWEGENDLYRAIIRDGEDLALEIMGKAVVPLAYMGEDRWKFRPNPSVVLAFARSDAGQVTGYSIDDHKEFRFEPSAGLPTADEVAARVAQAHRLDLLETLGPARAKAELNAEAIGIQGELNMLYVWPDRFRLDSAAGDQFEHLILDGERVLYSSSTQPAGPLEGPRADMVREEHVFARFGDWRRWYETLEVIQRIERGTGKAAILVRTGDTSAPARTFFVDEETGLLVHEDSLTIIEGLGRIGQSLSFGDFRDVSGMMLPHRTEIELANPLIGAIVTTTTGWELGIELPDDAFQLPE